MSKSVLELCVPMRCQKTADMFTSDLFKLLEPGFSFSSSGLHSGLVISQLDTNHLVHQAALSASYLGRSVLVVMPAGRWHGSPPTFHSLPGFSQELIHRIKFLYPSSLQEVVDHMVDLSEEIDDIPDTVILQHFHTLEMEQEEDTATEEKLQLGLVQIVTVMSDILLLKLSNEDSEDEPSMVWEDSDSLNSTKSPESEGKQGNKVETKDESENDEDDTTRKIKEPEFLCFVKLDDLAQRETKFNLWWKEIWYLKRVENCERLQLTTKTSNGRQLSVEYSLREDKYYLSLIELE